MHWSCLTDHAVVGNHVCSLVTSGFWLQQANHFTCLGCGCGSDSCSECRCPECAPGSLDLAASGNGRWQMQWVPIPCNVGESTFFYHAVSDTSNPYYYAFSVSNTRYTSSNMCAAAAVGLCIAPWHTVLALHGCLVPAVFACSHPLRLLQSECISRPF